MFYFLKQPFSFNAFPVPYYNFLTGHSCNNSGTFTCMSDNFHVSTLLRHVFIAMNETHENCRQMVCFYRGWGWHPHCLFWESWFLIPLALTISSLLALILDFSCRFVKLQWTGRSLSDRNSSTLRKSLLWTVVSWDTTHCGKEKKYTVNHQITMHFTEWHVSGRLKLSYILVGR